MARAAHGSRGQAPGAGRLSRRAVAGLAALSLACAVQEDPPGGPPDFAPPTLVSVTPDSGTTVSDRDRRVRFTFNEVIAERGLADLVTVSPRHERVDVRWDREAVTVRPDGGWRPDAAYVVRLAPGLLDLRGNRTTTATTTIFSTGAGFPTGLVTGTVIDWENGRRAAGALVEAIRVTDSLTHFTLADSSGGFTLPFLGAGEWAVLGTLDADRNRRRGRREAFDSLGVRLDGDTVPVVFWTFVHDSAGPALRDAARVDSVTVRLTFNGVLAPMAPPAGAVRAFLLPDTVPIQVDSVLLSLPTPPDTTARAGPAPADTAAVDSLVTSRPRLGTVWYVRLPAPLDPGVRYLFEATAANPAGATGTTRTVLVVPERPLPPGDQQ